MPTLILQPDNPCNTIITDQDTDEVLYTITTMHPDNKTITTIKNADGDVIASSKWRDVQSDIITLGNIKPIPASTWLRKSMMPFKDTVRFTNFSGKTYKWKGNSPGLAFELYVENDKSRPIARFHKSHRVFNKTVNPPTEEWIQAKLDLDARGAEIMDDVVVSFLLLEKGRRARENSTMNRADVLGTPISIGGTPIVNGGV